MLTCAVTFNIVLHCTMKIIPIRAWRPVSDEAVRQIACPPYDVISTGEARLLANENPLSFLHVIRPEIAFPEGTDEHDDLVYDAGAAALQALMAQDCFIQEEQASFYVYQLERDGRSSTGLFTGVRTSDYLNNRIVRHENTRPDKEDDRTRHIISQCAHAEPVMLLHPDNAEIDRFLQDVTREPALLEAVLDGVVHRIWVVDANPEVSRLYMGVPTFYVADGHHRCAAAARAAAHLEDEFPAASVFPAVVFGASQMQLMAYNRLICKAEPSVVNRWLKQANVVSTGESVPSIAGQICVYTADGWHTIALKIPSSEADSAEKLDVQRLQDQILAPVFGIVDPRTNPNIAFVGGMRGTKELQRLVDDGSAAVAFSMYPTSADELIAVSDAGLLMPPKSTWFEPKLQSGLLVHVFG